MCAPWTCTLVGTSRLIYDADLLLLNVNTLGIGMQGLPCAVRIHLRFVNPFPLNPLNFQGSLAIGWQWYVTTRGLYIGPNPIRMASEISFGLPWLRLFKILQTHQNTPCSSLCITQVMKSLDAPFRRIWPLRGWRSNLSIVLITWIL